MSTAKAKLHTEMARAGKKCRYETWQLPQATESERYSESSGLLEFNKEDPMFACKLHLPDGIIIHSSNFRRKKDAEQDAALHALQKVLCFCFLFVSAYSTRYSKEILANEMYNTSLLLR